MFLGSSVIGGEFKISVCDRKTINWWVSSSMVIFNAPRKPLHPRIDETHAH